MSDKAQQVARRARTGRVLVALTALSLFAPALAMGGLALPDLQLPALRAPDFSLSCSPTALTVAAGATGTSTCTVTSLGGFTDPVSLSCSTLPPGAFCGFSANPVSPPSGGSISSILTVNVFFGTAPGSYAFDVIGQSGALVHTQPMTLAVPPIGWSLSCAPSALTVAGGSSGTSSCDIASIGGFSSFVSLSCQNMPSGAWCQFSPNPATPPAGGMVTSVLTLNVFSGSPAGTFPFTVVGNDGFQMQSVPMTVTIPASSFSIACAPSSVSEPQGGSASTICTASSIGGFAGDVTVSCPAPPSGVFCNAAPNPISVPSGGSASSTVTLSSFSGTVPGTYPVTIRGQSGFSSVDTTVSLTITPVGVTVSCSPSSLTVNPSSSATSTCTASSVGGFGGSVSFSCPSPPSGIFCSFTPNPVAVPSGGSAPTTLTLSAFFGTAPGTYSVDVQANTGASLATFTLTVTVTPGGGFTIACVPNALTIPGGSAGSTTCTVSSVGGFGGDVSLFCPSPPFSMSCNFAPSTVTLPPGGSVNSVLTISVQSGAPAGTSTMSIEGFSGFSTAFTSVDVTVPFTGWSVACAPSSLTVAAGGSGTSTCTVSSIGGFSGNVVLSCANVPASTMCQFSPNPVFVPSGGSATSLLTVSVFTGAPSGTFNFDVLAQQGSTTASFTMTLTIPVSSVSFTCAPNSITVPNGGSASTLCTATSVGGFSGTLSLFCQNQPPFAQCSFSPNQITLPPGGSAVTTLTVSIFCCVPSGTYTFLASAWGSGTTASETITMTVP